MRFVPIANAGFSKPAQSRRYALHRAGRRAAILLTAALLSACGGAGDSPTGTVTPPPPINPAPVTPGLLGITVSGLPEGTNADITVTGVGAANFSRTATTTTGWTDVPPGQYTVTVRPVRASIGTFAPSAASSTVTVAAAALSTVTVEYNPQPSALAIDISGVPGGSTADVNVTPPRGTVTAVTQSGVITASAQSGANIAADRWLASAQDIVNAGTRYVPTPATIDTTVRLGDTAHVAIRYAIGSGAIAVAIGGLPTGVSADAYLIAPDNSSRPIAGTTTVTGLAAGRYKLVSRSLLSGGLTYAPSADTLSLDVTLSLVATPALVTYVPQMGRLAVSVSGLPNGAAAALTLTSAAGSRTIAASSTLDSLAAGSYTLTAAPLVAGGERYAPAPTTQDVIVTVGGNATASVTYALAPTTVDVGVSGLPGGTNAAITLTSPTGSVTAVTSSTSISPAVAGRWRLQASDVSSGGSVYSPAPASYDQTVAAGDRLVMPVQYALSTGAIAVVVSGLPNGSTGALTITGPSGFNRNVTSTTTLTGLVPGSYSVAAANVTASGSLYLASPTSQTVTVTASAVASPATVNYTLATGAIAVTVNGLPNGASAAVTVTGPNGFSRAVTASTTISSLTPGSYSIGASNVSVSGTTYAPTPTTQSVNVSASGSAATATVAYAANAGGVNYSISGVYLTQAIQKPDNSVTLVANRDALLRVFVLANGSNTAQPQVRVRIYDGATLLQTNTLSAPESSVRQSTAEGTLTSTWNLLVGAANVRPTMKVLVDLDPSAAIADADRSDNTWPSSGNPQSISVSTVPTFNVRFVPVAVGALVGNVSAANKESFLTTTRRIWPVQNVSSDVRATFTSSATDLQSNDGNNQWLTVLSEINTLRSTDGAPSTTHYYGVVKVGYTSGIAGYGYVPGRAAIGWDYLPSGDGVAAHEWGHNFSRQHAPCGVSGDASYPYAGGVTNYWGWNSTTNTLVSPAATDVMGYCSNNWVSDYSWTGVLNYRASSGVQAAAAQGSTATADKADGLLVWGRVVNGVIQLEPAFRVNAPITPAATRPTHRLDLVDNNGRSLLQLPIEASLVDHTEGRDERQFAVVVPWSATLADRLDQIRVADQRVPLRSVSRRGAFSSPARARESGERAAVADLEPGETLAADGPNRMKISWRNSGYGMAMVRDAGTGQIMGYVRRSGAAVVTGGRRVEVVFSDGVRSSVKALR